MPEEGQYMISRHLYSVDISQPNLRQLHPFFISDASNTDILCSPFEFESPVETFFKEGACEPLNNADLMQLRIAPLSDWSCVLDAAANDAYGTMG